MRRGTALYLLETLIRKLTGSRVSCCTQESKLLLISYNLAAELI